MTTHPIYDRILASITDETVRAVYHVLKNHVGKDNAISLNDLTLAVFPNDPVVLVIEKGKPTRKASETRTREIREAIEIMRNQPYDIPVCSNSGRAGRYLPATPEELYECSAEYIARGSKDIATGRNMERVARSWFARQITPPEHIPAPFEAVQGTLFELPKVYA